MPTRPARPRRCSSCAALARLWAAAPAHTGRVRSHAGPGSRGCCQPRPDGRRKPKRFSSSRRRSSWRTPSPSRPTSGPGDLVLEPSAGTGLLAIMAELAGRTATGGGADEGRVRLVLNELAAGRADLLARLFLDAVVTRCDAAQIDDHLDPSVRPTVVIMNPPFSALASVDGPVRGAAHRHLASALVRARAGRPAGRHHGREPFARAPSRSGWVRPVAGDRTCRVYGPRSPGASSRGTARRSRHASP